MPAGIESLNWTFTDGGGVVGSGVLNVSIKTGVVASMSGTYEGQKITFSGINDKSHGTINHFNFSYHPNDPAPGYNTLQGVPNTTGANFTYDDVYNPTANPGTGVDAAGILVSTGADKTKTYFDISLDYAGATQVDFFSIAKDGSYVTDEGVFSTSPVIGPAAARFAQASAAFAPTASLGGEVFSRSGTTPSALLALVGDSHHLA